MAGAGRCPVALNVALVGNLTRSRRRSQIASEGLKGRVIEASLADLNSVCLPSLFLLVAAKKAVRNIFIYFYLFYKMVITPLEQ